MLVDERRLEALTPDDIDAWRRLAAHAAEPNPFFEPDFLVPASRHLSRQDAGMLIVHDQSGWAACVPIARAFRYGRLPGRAVTTWIHAHCYLGTPLVDRDRLLPGISALLRYVRDQRSVSFFVLNRLGGGGVVEDALWATVRSEGHLAYTYHSETRPALVNGNAASYSATGKHRRALRRQERRLEERLGGEAAVRRRSDRKAIGEFLDLEASGWKGARGTALKSVGLAPFFEELCQSFANDDRLEIIALEAGGQTVAMRCSLLAGGGAFTFKIAHDERFADLSPGVQLEAEYVNAFEKLSTAAWADSCTTWDNEMMGRIWRDRRSVTTVLVPTSHTLGRLGRRTIELGLAVRERLSPEEPS